MSRQVTDHGRRLYENVYYAIVLFDLQWQETHLSQRDRATPYVSSNLVNCCTTVCKNPIWKKDLRWM